MLDYFTLQWLAIILHIITPVFYTTSLLRIGVIRKYCCFYSVHLSRTCASNFPVEVSQLSQLEPSSLSLTAKVQPHVCNDFMASNTIKIRLKKDSNSLDTGWLYGSQAVLSPYKDTPVEHNLERAK